MEQQETFNYIYTLSWHIKHEEKIWNVHNRIHLNRHHEEYFRKMGIFYELITSIVAFLIYTIECIIVQMKIYSLHYIYMFVY